MLFRDAARDAFKRARSRGHSALMLIGDEIEDVDFAGESSEEDEAACS